MDCHTHTHTDTHTRTQTHTQTHSLWWSVYKPRSKNNSQSRKRNWRLSWGKRYYTVPCSTSPSICREWVLYLSDYWQQEAVKNITAEREDLGVELYGVQQQLARQQMLIEKEQVRCSISIIPVQAAMHLVKPIHNHSISAYRKVCMHNSAFDLSNPVDRRVNCTC